MRISGLFLVFIWISFSGVAQPVEFPLYSPIHSQAIQSVAQNQENTQVSYGPLNFDQLENTTRILGFMPDSSMRCCWFTRKLFKENLIILDKPGIYFTIDPIFNFSGGLDIADSTNNSMYQNTRGLMIKGYFGKKVSFYTSFLENQARFPDYVTKFIGNTGVVPGSGRVKVLDNGGFDYSMATAYITWNATRFLRLKLGNDKDFLGTGYRSVLLSDNAFNYTHFKIDLWFAKRKFKYTLNYALLQNLTRLPKGETPESLFERKNGIFHYLSYKPIHNLEFGVFNGVIMPRNPLGESASFYVNYFMPIIFWNTIFNAESDSFVQKAGFNLSWFIFKNWNFYFQADIGLNDQPAGILAGIRMWDLFTKNLNFTIEYSKVGLLIFHTDTTLSFNHYNQSLAHPLGSGFDEVFFQADYTIKRFLFKLKYSYAKRKLSDAAYWGFIDKKSADPNFGYGDEFSTLNSINFEFQYLFNQKTNMNIAVGYTGRDNGENNIFGKTNYFYLAFRTSLRNVYVDF
jgi:hypothetical protein